LAATFGLHGAKVLTEGGIEVMMLERDTWRQPTSFGGNEIAIESARLLLSSSSRFPHGLANSSGLVGHYLTLHESSNTGAPAGRRARSC